MARFSAKEDEEDAEPTVRKRRRSRKVFCSEEDKDKNVPPRPRRLRIQEQVKENGGEEIEQGREEGSEHVIGSNSAISVTLTDPEVLDCSICYEPLTIPVYQCGNGHIACSSCCINIKHKCHVCSLPIGYNRCRAIEKVLESVKVNCPNVKYGCKEIVSYTMKNDHEKICKYAPCTCPFSDCNFVASSLLLAQHFRGQHSGSATSFCFNSFFHVVLKPDERNIILLEESEGILFIINNEAEPLGNKVTLSCMDPCASKPVFLYHLQATSRGTTLHIQSSAYNIQSRLSPDPTPSRGFLLIPSDFFSSAKQVSLELRIGHVC